MRAHSGRRLIVCRVLALNDSINPLPHAAGEYGALAVEHHAVVGGARQVLVVSAPTAVVVIQGAAAAGGGRRRGQRCQQRGAAKRGVHVELLATPLVARAAARRGVDAEVIMPPLLLLLHQARAGQEGH